MNDEFEGIRVKFSLGKALLVAGPFISVSVSLISLIDPISFVPWCISVTSVTCVKHIVIYLFILKTSSLTFGASVMHF